MRWNFSPARNVRSTTAPLARFFSFVRTKAPPLPGFTCWNPTIRQTSPSTSMCMPFLNWFVPTFSATARNLAASGAERADLDAEVRLELAPNTIGGQNRKREPLAERQTGAIAEPESVPDRRPAQLGDHECVVQGEWLDFE